MNAFNTQLLAPYLQRCWFVKDSGYNACSTLACVGNLKKTMGAT